MLYAHLETVGVISRVRSLQMLGFFLPSGRYQLKHSFHKLIGVRLVRKVEI